MWANKPEMAKRWVDHTETPYKKLPERVKKALAETSAQVLASLAAQHRDR